VCRGAGSRSSDSGDRPDERGAAFRPGARRADTRSRPHSYQLIVHELFRRYEEATVAEREACDTAGADVEACREAQGRRKLAMVRLVECVVNLGE
jgi:hypothetical protein